MTRRWSDGLPWTLRPRVLLTLGLTSFYLFWLLPTIAENPDKAGPLGNLIFALLYFQIWLVTASYALNSGAAFYGLPIPRWRFVFRFDNVNLHRGWVMIVLMFVSYALTVYGFGIAFVYLSNINVDAFGKTVSFVDGIYFSVVTAATVGYGDIVPRSDAAKVLTMAEIALSLVYVVLLFSAASSYARELRVSDR